MSDKSKISVVDNTLVIDSDISINGIFSNKGGNKNFGGITGEIRISILPAPPPGWLLCDGTLYSRSNYIDLSNVLGTLYGGNDTTFNVPDLRYRCVVGSDGNQTDVSGNTSHNSLDGRNTNLGNVGSTGGNDNYDITINNFIKHHHDIEDHNHDILSHNHTITHNHNISTHNHNHNTTALSSHTHNIDHNHNVNGHTHEMDHNHPNFYSDQNDETLREKLDNQRVALGELWRGGGEQSNGGNRDNRKEGNERGPVTEGAEDKVNTVSSQDIISGVQTSIENVGGVIDTYNFTTTLIESNTALSLDNSQYDENTFNYTSESVYQTVFSGNNDIISTTTFNDTTLETNPNVLSTNINNINNLIDTSGNNTIKNHYIPYMILNYIIKY